MIRLSYKYYDITTNATRATMGCRLVELVWLFWPWPDQYFHLISYCNEKATIISYYLLGISNNLLRIHADGNVGRAS